MLTAYYRVARTGNGKPRPDWYDPQAALRSFLVAADAVDARVVVVADGGVPDALQGLLPTEVVTVHGGSAPRGFRRLLDVARPADGLVWFAEDDHVYRPDALVALVEAAAALPGADYFSLYRPDNTAWHDDHASQPGHRGPAWRGTVGERVWEQAWDSTSSFGLRAAALQRDRALLRLCSRAGGPWDHTCVLAVQGERPYPWRHLYADLYLRPSRASAGRVVTRPLVRAAVDVLATARAVRGPRRWVAPAVDLATHAEVGHVAPGTDWAAVAESLG